MVAQKPLFSFVALLAMLTVAGCGGSESGAASCSGPEQCGGLACIDGVCATSAAPLGDAGAGEICDGFDNDGNGRVDETCTCSAPGETQRCFPGEPALAGVGICAFGTQTCTGGLEFNHWDECTGAGTPVSEVCDNGLDDDCDGQTDEGCMTCSEGAIDYCDTGMSDACNEGVKHCTGGAWGECEPRNPGAAEICYDGIDNDCDGEVDEDCPTPCVGDPTGSGWERNNGRGPACFGTVYRNHGDRRMFGHGGEYRDVPSTGWFSVETPNMEEQTDEAFYAMTCGPRPDEDLDERWNSDLRGGWLADRCLNIGDFTFFRTHIDIPEDYPVTGAELRAEIDDGLVVFINGREAAHLNVERGTDDRGRAISSFGADLLRPGRNEVVFSHVDDCPQGKTFRNVMFRINGAGVPSC